MFKYPAVLSSPVAQDKSQALAVDAPAIERVR